MERVCIGRERIKLNKSAEQRFYLRPRAIAHGGGGHLAVFKYKHGRDAGDAVARRQFRLLVDVYLADLDVVAGVGYLCNDRCKHAAGAAPAGPEINEYGLVAAEYFALKIALSDGYFGQLYISFRLVASL